MSVGRVVSLDYEVFKKTHDEKVLLKKAKRVYNTGMKSFYGKYWKIEGHFNVPTKLLDENKYKGGNN